MPQFSTYTPPPVDEGDTWSIRTVGQRGGQIIVKVREFRTGVITTNSPDGTDEVRIDVVDLGDPTGQFVYRNVPVWTGAVVDGLKGYAGSNDVLVLDVSMRKAKSNGREYAVINPASDFSLAERFYATKGDPFAQQFSTVSGGAAAAGAGQQTGSSHAPAFGSSTDDPPF